MFQSISRVCEVGEDKPRTNSRNNVTSPLPYGYARSAAEALKANQEDKFRQLPCRTYISVGACPYKERCVFLHDPRISSFESKIKTRNKNKEDIVLDALFWPVLPLGLVNSKLDAKGQPHCIQQYNVPIPQKDEYQKHDQAVFSMWQHFVAACMTAGNEYSTEGADINVMNYLNEEIYVNLQTGKPRLDVFYSISNDFSVDFAASEVCLPSAPVIESVLARQMLEFIECLEDDDDFPDVEDKCQFEPISWAPLLQPYTPAPKTILVADKEQRSRFTESPTDIASRISPVSMCGIISDDNHAHGPLLGSRFPLPDDEKHRKAMELANKIRECFNSLAELDEGFTDMPGFADFVLSKSSSLL